jgi:hypothetical protein
MASIDEPPDDESGEIQTMPVALLKKPPKKKPLLKSKRANRRKDMIKPENLN